VKNKLRVLVAAEFMVRHPLRQHSLFFLRIACFSRIIDWWIVFDDFPIHLA